METLHLMVLYVGLGYNRDLDTGAFVRVEATYMEFDGATLTNTS